MQDIAIFDLVVIILTLLLGIKGLFRGFIKEVFGIVGIVGAAFIASRVALDTGNIVAPLLNLENQTSIQFLGFVLAFFAIWLVVYAIGVVVSKIFSASGLGIIDRFFGFVFGMLKVVLIFSLLAYAVTSIKAFKKLSEDKLSDSILLPHLIEVGSYVLKLDINSINEKLQEATDGVSIKETTTNIVETYNQAVEEAKKQVEDQASELIQERLNETNENLNLENKSE